MDLKEIKEKFLEIKEKAEKHFTSPFELEPLDQALEKLINENGYTDELLELEDDIQDLRIELYSH